MRTDLDYNNYSSALHWDTTNIDADLRTKQYAVY